LSSVRLLLVYYTFNTQNIGLISDVQNATVYHIKDRYFKKLFSLSLPTRMIEMNCTIFTNITSCFKDHGCSCGWCNTTGICQNQVYNCEQWMDPESMSEECKTYQLLALILVILVAIGSVLCIIYIVFFEPYPKITETKTSVHLYRVRTL